MGGEGFLFKAKIRRMAKQIIHLILSIVTLVALGGSTVQAAQQDHKAHSKAEATRLLQAGDYDYAHQLYTSSMKAYLNALRIAEHEDLDELTARIYNSIGNLYSTQGDYQMGLYFYRKALAKSRHTGKRSLQNAVLNNLVGASCFVGQADSAQVYLRQMEANKEQDKGYHYNLLMGRGIVARSNNNPQEAADCYTMARAYALSAGMDSSFVDNTNSCLAELYMDTHRPDSAIVLLKMNEAWARRNKRDEMLAETIHLLAQAYDAKGDNARAAACRMEYADLMEKLNDSDELNAMKNTQFFYDADKNANTISLLRQQQVFDTQQIRTQTRWLILLGAGLAIIIVLFIIVYLQKRQLHHAYNRLYDRSQMFLSSPIQPKGASSQDTPTASEGETSDTPAPRALILSAQQRAELLEAIGHIMEQVDEFCQTDFSIDRLAQLVSSNPRYVSEAINEGYHKNFRAFLNEYRIKEAMHRLADAEHYGSFTIKAISESVGYKSQANFTAIFTKLTGMKPSIYQKISKEREAVEQ